MTDDADANTTQPHWLLHIEAVNLSEFLFDSEDLSTIRGAGLLLLNAGRLMAGLTDGKAPDQHPLLTPMGSEFKWNTVIETATQCIDAIKLIASGGSITQFTFSAGEQLAYGLRQAVVDWLRKHSQFAFATFAVAIVPIDQAGFLTASERAKMEIRLAQMRHPNVNFGPLQQDPLTKAKDSNFCDIDKKRSWTKTKADVPTTSEDKNFFSEATCVRRSYGQDTKVGIYEMIAHGLSEENSDYTKNVIARYSDFVPAWEFEEIARRGSWRHEDDKDGKDDKDVKDRYGPCSNKMAVVYIDGNQFGRLIRLQATTAEEYAETDRALLKKRRVLMRALIDKIRNEPRWQVLVPMKEYGRDVVKKKTRIETLLWGGDELIWVVPAWCALEIVQFFFDHTKAWALNRTQLTHAVGLVICSYKSPIREVVELAKRLAESVKQNLQNHKREEGGVEAVYDAQLGNALAYEVLESFDHLGRDFDTARTELRLPQMEAADSILTANQLTAVIEHLNELKYESPKLHQNRLHQIMELLHRTDKGDEWVTALKTLNQRIALTNGGGEKFETLLNSHAPFTSDDKLPAKWFHLMQLWTYCFETPALPQGVLP